MKTQSTFAKLFFASSAALLLAAAVLPQGMRAQLSKDESDVAVVGTDTADTVDKDVEVLKERCPGRVQPVCGEAQSGGIKLFFYFP